MSKDHNYKKKVKVTARTMPENGKNKNVEIESEKFSEPESKKVHVLNATVSMKKISDEDAQRVMDDISDEIPGKKEVTIKKNRFKSGSSKPQNKNKNKKATEKSEKTKSSEKTSKTSSSKVETDKTKTDKAISKVNKVKEESHKMATKEITLNLDNGKKQKKSDKKAIRDINIDIADYNSEDNKKYYGKDLDEKENIKSDDFNDNLKNKSDNKKENKKKEKNNNNSKQIKKKIADIWHKITYPFVKITIPADKKHLQDFEEGIEILKDRNSSQKSDKSKEVSEIYPKDNKDKESEEAKQKQAQKKTEAVKTYDVSVFYFPIVCMYLEFVFHIYMKLDMKYFLVYLGFAAAFGTIFSLLTNYFKPIANKIICYVLTGILSITFSAEIVCRTVLSQYYQFFSAADTAANNHLTDYTGAILKGIGQHIFGIILMFLPFVAVLIFNKYFMNFKRKKKKDVIKTVILFIVCQLVGWAALFLPYKAQAKPYDIYKGDTDIEQQVNDFGVITMLRLDVQHAIFGADNTKRMSSEDYQRLKDAQNNNDESQESQSGENNESGSNANTTGEIDTSPNVMNIDFDKLKQSEKGDSETWLNNYFSALSPTNKNQYTGKFKGYNVIMISAESFSGYMINEQLTPTLYKMTHTGFVFNNFYTPLHYTSTTNGECQNLLGLYPKNGEPQTMTDVGDSKLSMPFTLANQLNKLGYYSSGYHFNVDMYNRSKSHPQIGYDWYDSSRLNLEKDSNGKDLWPQSDKYMIDQTFDMYSQKQPFNTYYMTISGHMPYSPGGNDMTKKNLSRVQNLPYSEETKDYIAANLEVEDMMTELVNKLTQAGIADKTLIVMAPDHIPYADLPVLEELAGQKFGSSEDVKYIKENKLNFEVYHSSLIIWSPSMTDNVNVDKVCGQVDILPTVSNLLGLEYDSRLIEGTDIFSNSEGLVCFNSHSWKSDKGFYNAYTEQFTPATGVTMNDDEQKQYVENMNTVVDCKLRATSLIQDTNYYAKVFN